MEIAVCVKRVPLVGSTFMLTDDAMAIDTSRIGATLSPHEENAVEAAVRLIEVHGGEHHAVLGGVSTSRGATA